MEGEPGEVKVSEVMEVKRRRIGTREGTAEDKVVRG